MSRFTNELLSQSLSEKASSIEFFSPMDYFSTIPPEVLDIIVEYHMATYSLIRTTSSLWNSESAEPENKNLQLISLSLVSKFFYYAVMPIVMRSININIGDFKMATLIKLIATNPQLGGMIQELKTSENPGWHSNARTVPIERFLQLISKFVNLKSLSIEQSCDISALRSLTTVPLPQLPLINHIRLTFAIREEDVITQLIKFAPNLESLDVRILNFSDGDFVVDTLSRIPATASKFPFKSFEVKSSWETTEFDIGLLVDLDLEVDEEDDFTLLRFSLDSFIRLTTLTLADVIYSVTLLDILKVAGPTLEALIIIGSYFTFTGDNITNLFEHTKVLTTFQIQGRHLLHENFLHEIPLSMKILKTALSLKHLIYLQRHPRPGLQLTYVATQDFDFIAILETLPPSVEVFITRRFVFGEALEQVKARKISKALKTIIIRKTYRHLLMESDWVEKFKEIGITLELSD